MFRLHDLPVRDPDTDLINVVIDTPRGSRNKYKYDEKAGVFRLSRILPAGMEFPYDFGSIPRTRADDGDALDILVLVDAATFPGCLLNVQLLGVLRAKQKEKGKTVRNDRLIAVAQTPVNEPEARELKDLAKQQLHEIESFFVSYNRAQGREFIPGGRFGSSAAGKLLTRAMRAFDRAETSA
jgi:inorganic pyrophosphatase